MKEYWNGCSLQARQGLKDERSARNASSTVAPVQLTARCMQSGEQPTRGEPRCSGPSTMVAQPTGWRRMQIPQSEYRSPNELRTEQKANLKEGSRRFGECDGLHWLKEKGANNDGMGESGTKDRVKTCLCVVVASATCPTFL